MKSIALIHTVKRVANTFDTALREVVEEEIKIYNVWDEFLASNPDEIGEFSVDNRNRLFHDLKSAELTGADIIVTTCSTLTPIVDMIRPFIKVPVISIDDAMGKKGVTFGPRVLIMATAHSTLGPTRGKLAKEALEAGKEITMEEMVLPEAYDAMRALNMEEHDRILLEKSRKVKDFDCIILAQASMAHMEKEIADKTGIPVLSSPGLCTEQIKETLKNNLK